MWKARKFPILRMAFGGRILGEPISARSDSIGSLICGPRAHSANSGQCLAMDGKSWRCFENSSGVMSSGLEVKNHLNHDLSGPRPSTMNPGDDMDASLPGIRLRIEKVSDHLHTGFRGKRFRMKLYAFHGEFFMTNSHQLRVRIESPGRHFKAIRQGILFYN